MSEGGAAAGPPSPPKEAGPARALLRWAVGVFAGGDRVVALVGVGIVAWYVGTRGIYQGKASGDGFFGFMYLPGLVYFHTFDIAPNVPFWVPYLGHEKTGHVANACPIGPVLFWFPPYLVGLGIEAAGRSLAGVLTRLHLLGALVPMLPPIKLPPQPGQTAFDFWMAGLGSLAAGLCGVGLCFRVLCRKLGVTAARVGVVGGVLATPIVFYLVTQPLYQHATAFFCVTLFVERWDTYRSRGELTPQGLAILGALGGLAMEMRIQEAIFLLLPGVDVLRQLLSAVRQRRLADAGRHLGGGLLLGLCALLVFLPQIALWHYYFAALRTPQPAGHMRWGDPALVATLFGMRAGIFPWMPIFYAVVPGLWLARRPLGGLGLGLALLFVIELWVNASAWDHWGSWAFGPRRFTDATLTFAAGIGGLYHVAAERARRLGTRAAPRAVALIVGLCVAFNVLLAELVRAPGRLKSSGSGAFLASQWNTWARGPRWLGALLDRTGYPFVQPAGAIFALLHHVPLRTFEGVVGNYLIERDCRIHSVTNVSGFPFADPRAYVPEGIVGPPDKSGLVPVAPRVRILVPLFAVEPIDVTLTGDFGGKEAIATVRWNGTALPTKPSPRTLRIEVPTDLVHSRSRTNELELDLPPNTRLSTLDLRSKTDWWR